MRYWSATALLAVSWLFGLHYYQPAAPIVWTVMTVLGAALLAGFPLRLPGHPERLLTVVLLAPAVWFFAWPHRAAVLLPALGLLLQYPRGPRRWLSLLGRGLAAGGMVLLVQSAVVELYTAITARNHDLPWPLPDLAGWMARLLGMDAAVDGSTLVLGALRGPLRLSVAWEWIFDPVTLAFLAGGATLAALSASGQRGADRDAARSAEPAFAQGPWPAWRRLVLVVAVWIPLRAGVLLALLAHRAMRWDSGQPLNVMDQFLSPWLHLVLLAAPVLAAACFVSLCPPRRSDETEPDVPPASDRRVSAAALGSIAAASAVLAWLVQWEPCGEPLAGRIMVVERHSTWEPTTRPYDTTQFGEDSSYTYAAIYDYCSRYFEMSRLLESDAMDDATLARCDVLFIKTPTAPYAAEEIEAIRRFVARGGGLLLIGEHTDVFKSSSFLNEIAKVFGFKFRLDLLFCVGNPYVQIYQPPRVPHPIVQHLPPMTFAVSCSIDPGSSLGRAAVRSTGLWSLPPEYHTENFFPEAEYRPEMRYGAFLQLWTTRYGAGRVAAWTDSTIFSNFSAFEPGKTELMLGMLDWLNRRSLLDRASVWWTVVGLLGVLATAALGSGLRLAHRQAVAAVVVAAAGLAGITAGSAAVVAFHRHAMPVLKPVRPMVRVVLDRTVSDVPLSRGGFTQENGLGYGLFEQWIPRLGYFTARRSGKAAFDGDALIILCPQKSVSEDYRKAVVEFVANGGKLLVLDSPEISGSTANSLLWPFGLSVNHSASREGKLGLKDGWPGIAVQAVCEVAGGEPFMWVDQLPVASRVAFGQGRVMAVGFASIMNDNGLGGHWMAETNPEMLTRSDLLFTLVRALIEDCPVTAPPPRIKK